MNRLQNKVAVVTGANSGIGYATAQEFIAEGAQVIITGRNEAAVQKAVATLGDQARGVVSDSGQMDDVRRLADQVRALHPRIDVLFVNAGVGVFMPIGQVDEAQFDQQFNINVKGLYFTVQALLPLLNDSGSIILNSSTAASSGLANASVYSATKAAVVSLARTLSADLLERRIRVNAISPGPVETPAFGKLGLSPEAINSFADMVPMKRLGQPEEIAKVAVFFASDDSSFVLGEELIAGGGVGRL